jgi:PKD repeat protein
LYNYVNSGDYQVKLTSYNNSGCSDSIVLADTIHALPTPIADFTYTEITSPVVHSGQIQLVNNSLFSNTYLWDFGDNTTDASTNPIHQFAMYGYYDIVLLATNDFGCFDTAMVRVNVHEFHGLFVSNAFSPDYGPPEVQTFKPKGIGLKSYHIYIYDTWGNMVWESDKLMDTEPAEGWNGTDKEGKPLPQDAYVWKVIATFEDGTVWPGKTYENGTTKNYGTVTLLR